MTTCSFIPKCLRFPFFVRCISGPCALFSFLADDGAEMMVASLQQNPRSARSCTHKGKGISFRR